MRYGYERVRLLTFKVDFTLNACRPAASLIVKIIRTVFFAEHFKSRFSSIRLPEPCVEGLVTNGHLVFALILLGLLYMSPVRSKLLQERVRGDAEGFRAIFDNTLGQG